MNREIIELREVVVKLVPMLTGKGLTVTQRGAEAYVVANPKTKKPERLNIPNIPDTADESFIRAVQGFIDHEVAHVLITDWNWVGSFRAAEQKNMSERKKARLHNYHNMIEDTMIEREMAKLFPGSKKNIADLRRHFIEKITKPAVASAKSDKERFIYLLIVILRALAGHMEFQHYMDDEKLWDEPFVKEFVGRLPPKFLKDLPKVKTTKETYELAKQLDAIMHPAVPAPIINSINPKQGFTTGGDPIIIDGDHLVDLDWVRFDGQVAKIIAHTSTKRIVVESPAHAPGLSDVEIKSEHGQTKAIGAFEYVEPPPAPGGGGEGDPDDSEGESDDSDSDDDGKSQKSGKSQDKPEKKAGKGDGDGERDHSKSEGEEGESEEESAGAGDGGSDEDGEDEQSESAAPGKSEDSEKKTGDEKEDDAEASGDAEDDSDGEEADQSEGAGDEGDPEDDGEQGESADEEGDTDGAGDDGDPDESGEAESDEDGDEKSGADNDPSGDEDEDAGTDESDDDGQKGDGSGEDDDREAPGAEEAEKDDAGSGEEKSDTRIAIQTDDHEAGEVGVAEDAADAPGGGVGNGLGKSVFDFEDDAFDQADMSSQVAILIANEAVDLLKDNDYNVFTREFDRIEVLDAPEIDPTWVPALDEKTRAMTGRMSKDIERMMASQSHVVKVPGFRSGRLHAPSLHRIMTNDDRLFNRKQEHKSKDTAVTLLIDNSGSMGGAKIVTAMVAAYALSQTLERVNIANEVIGFTTGDHSGRGSRTSRQAMNQEIHAAYTKGIQFHRVTPIVMPIYKEFDERINSEVKKRIAYMAHAQRGMVTNVDGESLEYAAIRLLKRREKRKVMLVLSDGQPSGAANAAGHLKRTTEKLEKLGIDLVGIGIMDQAVRRFYKNHIVLSRIEDLPTEVMRELKAILAD